jgi:hypothetical protein
MRLVVDLECSRQAADLAYGFAAGLKMVVQDPPDRAMAAGQ